MSKLEWRLERQRKRITITQIAKHIGCSHALISTYENDLTGKSIMSLDKIIAY